MKITRGALKQLIQEELGELGLEPKTKVRDVEVKILKLGSALEKALREAQIVSVQLGNSYMGTVVQDIIQELQHAIEKLQEN